MALVYWPAGELRLMELTVGAVVSTVTDLLPVGPVLPAASVWVAANVYVPSAEMAVVRVRVHDPEEQVAVDGVVGFLPSVTPTSPSPVVQEPPTELMFGVVE